MKERFTARDGIGGGYMSESMKTFRELERKLMFIRFCHGGLESKDEDFVLEEMDEVWWQLSQQERDQISSEGPKTLLNQELPSPDKNGWKDNDIGTFPDDQLREVAA
jgi:hypothetical protein